MNPAPLVVIGAGLAGWTTVREFRKLDSTTEVHLITADSGDFYAKPTLSNAYAQKRLPPQLVTTPAAKMAETLAKSPSPMSFQSALNVIRDVVKANPEAIVVNEGANTLDFARSIVDMYEPRKRLDVGTWGIMGIGMGFAVAASVTTGKPTTERSSAR